MVDGNEILVQKKVHYNCHDNLIVIRSVTSISTDNFADCYSIVATCSGAAELRAD